MLCLAALCLLVLGLSSPAHGQESSFPLTVEADDGSTVRLTLGVDPDATSGVDNGDGSTEDVGEESLPPLGTTVFEARFTSGTLPNVDLSEGVSRDIRKKTDPLGDPTHEVTFVIPSSSDVTLDWDFPSGAEGELTSESGLSETLSGDNQMTVSPGELTEVTGPGNANTYRATLEVTYNGLTGGGPAASDDQFQVTEDQPEDLDVLSNDSDPESDPLRPSVVQGEGPDNGTVSFNSADNTFTYNPDDDFNGTDAFTYEAADGFGGRAEADVTVNVSAVNDAPTVSTNAGLTLDEGATSSITTGELSASDVDDAASDLTFTVTSGPSNGTLLVGGSEASSFTQQDLEGGSVEYAHNGSETTSDSFTFDLTDAAGAGPSGQTFDVTVNAVNDAPAFEAEVSDKAIDEDQTAGPYSFTISDAETQEANLTLSGTSSNTDLVPSSNIKFGGSGKDRTVTVTPRPDSNGTAGITLTVSDGEKTSTSTFNLAVRAVNDAPTVATNGGLTVEVGATGSITAGQLSASDPDDQASSLTFSVSSGPSDGTLLVGGSQASSFTQENLESGAVEYRHDGSQTGSDSFTFDLTDAEGEGPSDQSFSVSIVSSNEAPSVATNSGLTLNEGATSSITTGELSGTDPDDPASSLTFSVTGGPENGAILVGGSEASSFTQQDLESGSVQYAHDGSETTSDSFTFDLTDAADIGPSGRTFDISVNPVNDAPTFEDEVADRSVEEDQTAGPYSFAISDPETPAGELSVSGESGNADLVPGDSIEIGGEGANRTVTAAPRPDSNGTAQIALILSDGEKRDTSSFELTVEPVNDPPSAATNAGLATEEGDTTAITTGQLSGTDVDDPASDLTFSVTNGPENGAILVGGSEASSFTQQDLESGSVQYAHDGSETTSDSFTFDLTDAAGAGPSGQTFDIEITPVNEPPTISEIGDQTIEEDSRLGPLGLTVSDPETLAEELSLSGESSNPDLVPSDSIVFSGPGPDSMASVALAPRPDSNGTAQIALILSDGELRDTTSFGLTVEAVNDTPQVATNEGLATEEGDTTAITTSQLSGTDVDDPASDLTFSVTGGPENGAILVGGSEASNFTQQDLENGSVQYAHDGSETTSDSFTFDLTDAAGAGPSGQTFDIEITPVNEPPTISEIGDQTIEEDSRLGPLGLAVSDPDTPPEDLSLSGESSNPDLVPADSIVFSGPGPDSVASVALAPRPDSNGTSQVDLILSDGEKRDTTSFELTVEPVNDPPSVISTLSNKTLRVPGPPLRLVGLAEALFRDPEGEELSVSGSPEDSSVVRSVGGAPGGVALRPESAGRTSVTITASDGTDEASTSFQVTVKPREGEEPVSRVVVAVSSPESRRMLDFGKTGTKILAKGLGGGGSVDVRRFGSAPEDTSGISEENVSRYRTVIGASPTLSFGSDTEVRFPVGDFPGIEAPGAVTVYSRPEKGTGTFGALPTSVDDGGTPGDPSDDEIIATTGSFSEFVLASDTEPLPVELVSFEATRDGEGSVHLEWWTASETNNAGFRIQRTAGTGENASWSNVGFVDTKAPDGSTTEPKSYRFTDGDLPYEAEAVRYRLKQVDTDGTAGYSDPVTVKRRVTEVELLGTYPNPAQTRATVRYALPEKQNVSIHLYDVLGRQVRTVVRSEQSGRHKRRVDLNGLPSGVYFLRLRAGGQTRTQKLTVAR